MPVDIKKELKGMIPHIKKAVEENLNEADTVRRVSKLLEDILGYDGFNEITREQQIKGKYVDLAVKLDGATKFLIEVKSAGTVLRDRHIEQAQNYAAQGNIKWVVLTNSAVWNLYHLSFDEGIEYEHAFVVDLVNDPINKSSEMLSILHKQSIIRGELEEFWKKQTILSPKSIGKVLFNEETLRLIRRLIRKQEGILIDEEDLGKAIQSMFSPEAREQIGPFKIYKQKKNKKAKNKSPESIPEKEATQISDQSRENIIEGN